MTIKIFIADSQARVRFGLCLLLEQHPGWKVTEEITNGQKLLESARRNCPDLVLLDWELPGLLPEELLPILRQACPAVCVIALGGGQGLRQAALQAGADAFASKMEPPEKLLSLIRELCTPERTQR